jgi:membrane protein implicated in regulation of membrane protease activity
MAGRLVGMAVEGVGTWLLLMIGGVPMAALLGILTGLLAFIPNIGAIVSGVLIVLAGFSVSTNAGLWAIAVYFIVQTVDGYLIVPYVARKTVDLAPARQTRASVVRCRGRISAAAPNSLPSRSTAPPNISIRSAGSRRSAAAAPERRCVRRKAAHIE